MKDSQMVDMLLDDFYVIHAVYNNAVGSQPYSWKVPNGVQVEVGDFIIVHQSGRENKFHPFSVVQVIGIGTPDDLNYESGIEYQYIVGKVDTSDYNAQLARIEAVRQAMNSGRKANMKETVRAQLLAINPALGAMIPASSAAIEHKVGV